MKERPILFNAEMVRAVLAGRKTQTRRVVKAHKAFAAWDATPADAYDVVVAEDQAGASFLVAGDHGFTDLVPCPYGRPARTTLKPIPSTGGAYFAGDDGRIYRDGRALLPWGGGYKRLYQMVSAGSQRKAYVHRLVCEAFYGPAPDGLSEVRHLDGDPANNRPENLDWGTKQQNAADRSAHGSGVGESHPAARLATGDVEAIRLSSMSRRDLANQYGVSVGAIDDVRCGRTWTAFSKAPPPNLPRYTPEQPGDRLWGRETHCFESDGTPFYRADGELLPNWTERGWRWRPSIHMPRWASRILLEVTAVRVERVQDITQGDMAQEGWPKATKVERCGDWGPEAYRERAAWFRTLWDSINAKRGCGWDANPWVWVVEFRRLATPPTTTEAGR